MRILLIDPDANITGLLQSSLSAQGCDTDVAASAEDALRMQLERYGLIITETDLGAIDGYELLDRLRDNPITQDIPVIFCTTRDGESDLIDGLNAGADDYVVKPFSLREFMARIRSLLRRHAAMTARRMPVQRTMVHQGLNVSVDTNQVSIDGAPVMLTKTEFQILTLLFRNRNQLFNRSQIFDAVWPGQAEVSARTVDVNISRLRKKLGNYGKNIVNRSGYGYGYME